MALRSPKPRPGRASSVRPARRCRGVSFESVKVRAYRRDPARIEGTQDALSLEGANIGRREVDAPRAVHRLRMHAVPVPPHEPLQPVIGRLPGHCGMGRRKLEALCRIERSRGHIDSLRRARLGEIRLTLPDAIAVDDLEVLGFRRPASFRAVDGVARAVTVCQSCAVLEQCRSGRRREVGLEPSRPAAMTDRTVFAASM